MELQSNSHRTELNNTINTKRSCTHGRLIDNILINGVKLTGRVRCLECGAEVDDPHHTRK